MMMLRGTAAQRRANAVIARLSRRDQQIIQLRAEDWRLRQIAEHLELDIRTVVGVIADTMRWIDPTIGARPRP
jgi:FixJ family two-component response regulator